MGGFFLVDGKFFWNGMLELKTNNTAEFLGI